MSLNQFIPTLTYIYNLGYAEGHHNTVESQYIDIHHTDLFTFHRDIVEEIIKDLDKGEINEQT